jgi:hypothetical protein
MTAKKTPLQWGALLIGYVMIGIVAYLNTFEDIQEVGLHHPHVLSVWVLALGAAFGATIMEILRVNRKYIAFILALVGVIAGEGYGFVKGARRILNDEAAKEAAVLNVNKPMLAAEEKRTKAENAYVEAMQKADDLRTGRDCNLACQSYEKRAKEAKDAQLEAERFLAKSGPYQVTDRLAETSGLSQKVVSLVPALAFPTALVLMGIVLIAFGSSPLPLKTVAPAPTGDGDGDGTRQEPPLRIEPITATKKARATKREEEAIAWVRQWTQEHGAPPAFKVVQSELKLSGSTTSKVLDGAGVNRKRRTG